MQEDNSMDQVESKKQFAISDLPDIIIGNFFDALFEAVILYISITITIWIFLFLNIPSLTELIVMWVLQGILELFTQSDSAAQINQYMLVVENSINHFTGFFNYLWNEYWYYICFTLAYFDSVLADLGINSLRFWIKGKWNHYFE